MLKKCLAITGIALLTSAFCSDITAFQPLKGVDVIQIKNPELKPYVSDCLDKVEDAYESIKPRAIINAGFFDPKTSLTISYVIKDKVLVSNPEENESLMQSTKLQPYLRRILDRTEFRVLSCQNKVSYDITNHFASIPQGCEITDSIQAGPMLWPKYTAEEEVFIIKENGKVVHEGAGALAKNARSAIGFKGNDVYFIAVSNKNPMTMDELAEFVKKMKLDKVMALDGGSSTSLIADINNKKIKVIANKNDQSRRVKSFWYIK